MEQSKVLMNSQRMGDRELLDHSPLAAREEVIEILACGLCELLMRDVRPTRMSPRSRSKAIRHGRARFG